MEACWWSEPGLEMPMRVPLDKWSSQSDRTEFLLEKNLKLEKRVGWAESGMKQGRSLGTTELYPDIPAEYPVDICAQPGKNQNLLEAKIKRLTMMAVGLQTRLDTRVVGFEKD